jgi:hypothetical protein
VWGYWILGNGIVTNKGNYSVIIFCDHEFFRPVRDDMLVENNTTNCASRRDAMLVILMIDP